MAGDTAETDICVDQNRAFNSTRIDKLLNCTRRELRHAP